MKECLAREAERDTMINAGVVKEKEKSNRYSIGDSGILAKGSHLSPRLGKSDKIAVPPCKY
jgi:hypothetical protein